MGKHHLSWCSCCCGTVCLHKSKLILRTAGWLWVDLHRHEHDRCGTRSPHSPANSSRVQRVTINIVSTRWKNGVFPPRMLYPITTTTAWQVSMLAT